MQDIVNHIGTITKIEEPYVWANVVSGSACASCRAKGLCLPSEQKTLSIKAELLDGQSVSIGESVRVCMDSHLAGFSVFLAYIMPLCVLFGLMFGLIFCGIDGNFSGLMGLLGVVVYFVFLWFFRNNLSKKYRFFVEKI